MESREVNALIEAAVEAERERCHEIIAVVRERMGPLLYFEISAVIESGLTVEEWSKQGDKPRPPKIG